MEPSSCPTTEFRSHLAVCCWHQGQAGKSFGQLQESTSGIPKQGRLVCCWHPFPFLNKHVTFCLPQAKIGRVQPGEFIALVNKVNLWALAKMFFVKLRWKRGTSKQPRRRDCLGSRNICTEYSNHCRARKSSQNQPIIWSIYIAIKKNGFCLLQVYILFSILSIEQTPRQSCTLMPGHYVLAEVWFELLTLWQALLNKYIHTHIYIKCIRLPLCCLN